MKYLFLVDKELRRADQLIYIEVFVEIDNADML